MSNPLLHADGLLKRYGTRTAVNAVSLTVHRGELLGLLGPNGAGKSTLLSMLAGRPISPADAASRRGIGLVTQELALYETLSARANLELFGALYGLGRHQAAQRASDVLAQVGLADRAKDRPAQFSGGMKRRLHIGCALVHDPQLLLLDEPTAGVDPQSRNAIFELLEQLRDAGKALVYTTHYMEEIERLADRIVIIDHGSEVAEGTLAALLRRLPATQKLELAFDGPDDASALDRQRALLSQPGVRDLQHRAGQWTLAVDELTSSAAQLTSAVSHAGLRLRAIGSGRVTLEDVFLQLTGRALRD